TSTPLTSSAPMRSSAVTRAVRQEFTDAQLCFCRRPFGNQEMARRFYKAACAVQRFLDEWLSLEGATDRIGTQSAHRRERMKTPVRLSRASIECVTKEFLK